MQNALLAGTAIPGFNVEYLPVIEPVVRALRDTRTVGFVMVARLDWTKFEARSPKCIRGEYEKHKDERYTRLHMDHVPVIDEDEVGVDFEDILKEAVDLGYESVMIDGSRLPLEENIACTRRVTEMAHKAGVAVEAELGAVMGHEEGPLPPYEELFASGRGFTDPAEARRFVRESGADWLSVAIGSVHGAISAAQKDKAKVRARLNIEHLEKIRGATQVPLVLHGGTGIGKEYIVRSIRHGIAKINIATAIRQPYERLVKDSVAAAQQAVYDAAVRVIRDELEVAGSASQINPSAA